MILKARVWAKYMNFVLPTLQHMFCWLRRFLSFSLTDLPTGTYFTYTAQWVLASNLLLLFSHPVVSDSAIPWNAALQAFLSLTIFWTLPKFMFTKSVMPSSQLILWHPLLLLPSIFPCIRDFSNESSVHIRWPKYKWLQLLLKHKYLLLFNNMAKAN